MNPALYSDLTGKTVMVVGANTGIGFETAKHFAQMNPKRLILACRSEKKGLDAISGAFVVYHSVVVWAFIDVCLGL